ncbi:MAG: BamA/TamA family outer membrane protein [Terracidiphilus sp.]|jgi:outer membrane protein assembly factor BamA
MMAAACLLLETGFGVWAQQDTTTASQANGTAPANGQFLSSYEGQNVIAVEVAGRLQAAASAFAPLFVQKAGEPFSIDRINQTETALKKATKATNVRVQVDAEADGLRVQFILEPAVYFGIFEFPGAERFSYSRLVQVANFQAQTPFNADDVEQDRQGLVTFFRQQGYFKATVEAGVKMDEVNGLANIYFGVDLNRQAKFGDIEIVDAPNDETGALNHSLQTLGARFRGVAIRPGRHYHFSTLSKATKFLQARLEKQGYLGADVKLAGAEYHADTNRAEIHFAVKSGPKSQVSIEGAHLWGWTRKSLLPEYQGVGVDDESVEEGRQALVSYFQAKGFFDAKVDATFKKDTRGNTVVYQISKEKKHKVSLVELSGISRLAASDLTPHLTVQKSHLFSPGKFSQQLVRSSVKNLKAVYEAEGFSSVQVASSVSRQGGNVQVSFRVTEGPRDIVNSLAIQGDDTLPETQFAPKGLKLAAGQAYSQAHVEADRAEIVANYLQAGYLNSSFRETATEVSKDDPHHINVVYHIYEGPKVIAGKIVTLGRTQTHQRLINQDVSGIKPGAPLTESELLTAGSSLYDHAGVFDWAEVDPKRQITTQSAEDVVVKVHEASRNQITYGIGFEVIDRGGSIPSGTVALPGLPPVGLPSNFSSSEVTYYGPRGSFEYTRNNVGGKGDQLSFTGFAGRLDQRGGAYYIVPDFLWSRWKATTSVSAERNEENPIFSAQQELASAQLQRPVDKAKKDTLFLRYSFTQTDLTRILIPNLVLPQDQHVRLSTLAANLTRDTRDNPMDEHKGVLQSIEVDFNDTKLGSSVDFAKLTAQVAFYKQGFHNIVWANSVRIGLAQPFANSSVPLSEEFFTGGGNSLRGFPLDGAGPQRQVQVCPNGAANCNTFIQVPEGGNELMLINSEARIPLRIKKGLGLVVFYDGGNVFPDVGFHNFTSLYSNNVGLGLRYKTPIGPIRFDMGQNLNPVTGIQATNYFISIGQAF